LGLLVYPNVLFTNHHSFKNFEVYSDRKILIEINDVLEDVLVRIKNLLNHTHGIHSLSTTWITAYIGYIDRNEELFNDLNTDFEYYPGNEFCYSNIGLIIAGMAVESVTANS